MKPQQNWVVLFFLGGGGGERAGSFNHEIWENVSIKKNYSPNGHDEKNSRGYSIINNNVSCSTQTVIDWSLQYVSERLCGGAFWNQKL